MQKLARLDMRLVSAMKADAKVGGEIVTANLLTTQCTDLIVEIFDLNVLGNKSKRVKIAVAILISTRIL